MGENNEFGDAAGSGNIFRRKITVGIVGSTQRNRRMDDLRINVRQWFSAHMRKRGKSIAISFLW
jgi:hypothetical protein